MTHLFVLGASDPEMSAIETLLTQCSVPYVCATIGDRRVTAGEAYRADPVVVPDCAAVYLVECQPQGVTGTVIDHHRPGDSGFGRGPEDFFDASSIGQVWAQLVELGLISGRPAPSGEVSLIAAADHCLAHAYAGRCPGICPNKLMRYRVKQRASFQGRDASAILADIEAARVALLAAPTLVLASTQCEWHSAGHSMSDDCCNERGTAYSSTPCDEVPVRDIRGTRVPELPEAGTRYGIAYIADGLPGPDGRVKIVCSGPKHVIEAFLDWAPRNGLVDCYGDPARGFAGAYQARPV